MAHKNLRWHKKLFNFFLLYSCCCLKDELYFRLSQRRRMTTSFVIGHLRPISVVVLRQTLSLSFFLIFLDINYQLFWGFFKICEKIRLFRFHLLLLKLKLIKYISVIKCPSEKFLYTVQKCSKWNKNIIKIENKKIKKNSKTSFDCLWCFWSESQTNSNYFLSLYRSTSFDA